jgi:hypothetical protein
MNELPQPLPFRRSFASGHEDSETPDDLQAAGIAAQGGARDGAEPDAVVPSVRLSPKLLGLAALAGAVAAAAVVAVVAGLGLTGRDDPRLAVLQQRNAELAQLVQGLTDKMRALETGFVAADAAGAKLSARLQEHGAALGTVKADLEQLVAASRQSRDEQAGVSAPALFGVAVVQLRDALEAGRPFVWELVNLRGIAGTAPTLLAQLNRLAPLATEGVPTDEQLAVGLQVLKASDSLSGRASLLNTGVQAFTRVFGNATSAVPGVADPQLLQRAAVRLSAGDYDGTMRDLAALRGPVAREARTMIDGAQRRATAQDAVEFLSNAARDGLQQQMRASMKAP